MKTNIPIFILSLGIMMSCNSPQDQSENRSTGAYSMDRTILPIQPPEPESITEMDARNVEKPDIFDIKAP